MVRISDILRRMGGKEEESPKKMTPPTEEEKKETPPPSVEKAPVQFRDKVIPTTQWGIETSEALYERFLNFTITEILGETKAEQLPIEGKKIREGVEPVVDRIQKGDPGLLYLATTRSTPDYYLYAHVVNTCIFSVFLGAALGYERESLIILAMGALLHDVGMVKVMDIVQQDKRLSTEEKRAVEKHVQFNVDFLKHARDLPEKSIMIAHRVHERHNGGGYPIGLLGETAGEEAQIVGLSDVYEALCHPRRYRKRLSPFQALKEILKEKGLFNPRLLKLFLQQLTVYPIGCWVELSTGEQGEVMMTAPDLPLRPTIKIFFDSRKKKLAVPKIVDLSQHATLFV